MTMAGRTVELTVAGESCRVVTTADESELRRLAAMVEDRLAGVWQPGRPVTTKAMLLAAVALAHELDEQRARADAIAGKAREALASLLGRVDVAIEQSDVIAREREGRRRRKLGTPSERSSGGMDSTRRPEGDWEREDE
jgi:cell division protein ZapA